MIKKLKTLVIYIVAISVLVTTFSGALLLKTEITVEAHSGRTDSSGGHRDNKNKSGLGSYHYHCGGNPAHLHKNGECPYSTKVSSKTVKATSSRSKTSSSSKKSDKELIKKVQAALNDLGYDCGKVDGILGKKTKAALEKFQDDNNLTVDGKIGKEVKKALNIK